jgi:hypothetical protein
MRSGNRDVFTMNVDGTGVQRITSGPEQEWHPVWSSNDALAYNKAYGQRLAVEEVTRTGRGAPWSAPNELVADAGALFGASADRASYVYVDSGVAWQVHTGSHTVTPVMRRGTLPRPLPWVDVRGNPAVLYFATAGSRGYIEAADPIRGTLRKLVTFETLAPDRRISAVATDGRRAYFTLGAHEADIWIAELERR